MQMALWQILDDYEDYELAYLSDLLKEAGAHAQQRGDNGLASKYYATAVAAMVCLATRQSSDEPYGINNSYPEP